jgi:SAM-dependent methyltransferase
MGGHLTSSKRARRALERQLDYQKLKTRIDVQRLIAYGMRRAAYVRAEIEKLRPLVGARLLEVGSGVHGNVFFLGIPGAIGIDPLAGEYRKLFPAIQERARTTAAFGEELPFEEGSFDIVISDNVIDHAGSPARILSEIVRVLAPGGLLYLTVHVHHPIYSLVSAVYGVWTVAGAPLEIPAFADHTVHFTPERARRLMRRPGLRVMRESTDVEVVKRDLRRRLPRGLADWIKRAFYKNATYEVLAERSSK